MRVSTIILCRHGRPHLSRNVLLGWQDYERWWADYDLSGLREGQAVPPQIQALAQDADMLISSPLLRALETARMTRGGAEPDLVLPHLIEAPLPPPRLPALRMRPISWGTVSRISWMAGRHGTGESAREAAIRAGTVADELATHAQGKMVFVTAHGWFNRMVGRALRKQGWRLVAGRGDHYWSYRRYEKA